MDVRKLRQQVERERGGRRRPRGYSAALRAQVIDHVRQERAAGRGLDAVASGLGLSRCTIFKWMNRAKRGGGGFRRVTVQSPSPEATLITPGGYRLQGDATSVAAVLRAMAS